MEDRFRMIRECRLNEIWGIETKRVFFNFYSINGRKMTRVYMRMGRVTMGEKWTFWRLSRLNAKENCWKTVDESEFSTYGQC